MILIPFKGPQPLIATQSIGVQGDHHTQTVRFIFEKIQGELDLLTCIPALHLQIGTQSFVDTDLVTSVDEDKLYIDWPVPLGVTYAGGLLKIKLAFTEGTGADPAVFNSKVVYLEVTPSFEGVDNVPTQPDSLTTQLLSRTALVEVDLNAHKANSDIHLSQTQYDELMATQATVLSAETSTLNAESSTLNALAATLSAEASAQNALQEAQAASAQMEDTVAQFTDYAKNVATDTAVTATGGVFVLPPNAVITFQNPMNDFEIQFAAPLPGMATYYQFRFRLASDQAQPTLPPICWRNNFVPEFRAGDGYEVIITKVMNAYWGGVISYAVPIG